MQGPAFWPTGAGNMYGTETFSLSCGNKVVEVGNTTMRFDGIVNQNTSEFNEIKLLTTKTFLPASIVDTTTLDCSADLYSATVTTSQVVTNVQ